MRRKYAPLENYMQIKVMCECPVPKLYSEHPYTYTTGWWLWKKTHKRVRREWNPNVVVWFCPKCGTEWRYSGKSYHDNDREDWEDAPGSLFSPWDITKDKRSSWKKVPIPS